MECDRCEEPAVIHTPYSGSHLCGEHLCRSVEKRVRRRIRQDDLVSPDLTPDEPETWMIGLSGGKDSAVLTTILQETFAEDPRIQLVALTVHEGIEGYRDESLEACRELAEDLEITHRVATYREEFDIEMDELVADPARSMAPCAYCGVFRRDVLEAYATEFGADKLLTGHNLDDEAQTALMNYFEGDLAQIAKHHEASLGSFEDRRGDSPLIPRAKPLRDIPEREVALFAHIRDLPAHMAECPHAEESFRREIQQLLHKLEDGHPGTRHSIMAGYERIAAMLAKAQEPDDEVELEACPRCGSMTTSELCRSCQLLEQVKPVS